MASVNKVILIGNLGRDPEIRYMPSGEAVANFSIATTDTWKDKQGQKQEKTEWHNISMFGRLAEIAGQYLKKGSSVFIEGRLQTRKWQDKQTGTDTYTTEIIANEMKMLGSKGDGGQQDSGDGYASASGGRPAMTPHRSASLGAGQGDGYSYTKPARDDFEDDIPFLSADLSRDVTMRRLRATQE